MKIIMKQHQRTSNLTQQSCIVFHSRSVILKGSGPSIEKVSALPQSQQPLSNLSSFHLWQNRKQVIKPPLNKYLQNQVHFLACLTVFFVQRKVRIQSSIFLHNIFIIAQMSNLKQSIITTNDLLKENDRLNRDLICIKTQLYELYQENLKLREIVKQQENEKQFYKECESEIARLKVLMKQNNQKRKDVPTEREEIKDRIIMKLEDQLISTKIQLKQAQFQLAKLNRHK